MAKKNTDHRTGNRASAAFQLLRQFVVRALASAGTPTVDIAKSLGLSRSFTIKQAHIVLKPRTAAEKRILKVASENEAKLKRAGIGGLMGGEDIITVLAGGERAKLGPLKARIAKRAGAKTEKALGKTPRAKANAAKKAEKAKTPTKASAPPKKESSRKAKVSKPKTPVVPAPAPAPKSEKPARTRKPRAKASDLKAPLPATKLKEDEGVIADTAQATIDDLLADTSEGAPPADTPI